MNSISHWFTSIQVQQEYILPMQSCYSLLIVYICIYVYIYVYMYIYMYVCIYIYIYICIIYILYIYAYYYNCKIVNALMLEWSKVKFFSILISWDRTFAYHTSTEKLFLFLGPECKFWAPLKRLSKRSKIDILYIIFNKIKVII